MAEEKRIRISERKSERINRINLNNLKVLFESQDLLSLELSDTRVRLENKPKSYETYIMSPFSRKIYDLLSTEEKPRFRRDLYLDDLKIDLIEEKGLDENYNPNEQMYDYLEYYISLFFRCPVCREKSFRKYANISMPVIDIVCVNDDHPEDKTRYFQIKTTNGSLHFGEPYFSKNDRFIKVGSDRYGYNIHNITTNTDKNYHNMLIGYICIEYIYNEIWDHIKINNDNSFYIVPELLEIPNYQYINRHKIKFITEPRDIREIYDDINIPKYYFFTPKIETNPLNLKIRQPLFEKNKYYKLYLKYKLKYIKLKMLKMQN